MQKKYQNINIARLPKSQVEISGEITLEAVELTRSRIMDKLKKDAEMPGFRKGHIPNDILIKRYGEQNIFEDMVESSINDAYPDILAESKMDAIGNPSLSISKIVFDTPPSFKITIDIIPDIILGDYKKLLTEAIIPVESVEVTEKDITDATNEVRKNLALTGRRPLKSGLIPSELPDIDENDLPDIDDEVLRDIGGYQNYDEFLEKLTENLKLFKEERAKEKRKSKIIALILEMVPIDLPQTIIDAELHSILNIFKQDLENAGYKYEDYLNQSKKTETEVLTEWIPMAENKAKTQLIISKIALSEEINVTPNEVKESVDNYIEKSPSAEQIRVTAYFMLVLSNEKVLDYLYSLPKS